MDTIRRMFARLLDWLSRLARWFKDRSESLKPARFSAFIAILGALLLIVRQVREITYSVGGNAGHF